ncbi:Arginase [Clostridiaceae bacterium JG1575]|nr:Arginase [Clostridiaceae bacterium JG1575]
MKIDLINIPLFYGCDRPGVEEGPKVLSDNGLKNLLTEYGNEVVREETIDVPPCSEEDKYKAHPQIKYLESVKTTNEALAQRVEAALKEGLLPFNIGGDHALGMGSLAGISCALGNEVGVLWIDAHADINTPQTSPSGNSHGMPLAVSMGEGLEELCNLHFKGQKVHPNNCFIIGARSVDDGEVALIDRLGINVWYMEELRERGMAAIIRELFTILDQRGLKDLHLSYDIDSLDMSLVPGTGTPVPNGMNLDESQELISAILQSGKVRSIDFVEFNPKRDHEDQVTLHSCLTMLRAFAQALGTLS